MRYNNRAYSNSVNIEETKSCGCDINNDNVERRTLIMNTKDLKVLGLAFICLSLIASLQSCATQGLPPEESLLANEELVEFFRVPQTAKVTTRNGMGTIKYTPDGVQTYQAFESGFFDTGKYRIVDNTICGSWTEIRSGKEACSKVYKVGEKTYRFIDTNGKNAGTLKFK